MRWVGTTQVIVFNRIGNFMLSSSQNCRIDYGQQLRTLAGSATPLVSTTTLRIPLISTRYSIAARRSFLLPNCQYFAEQHMQPFGSSIRFLNGVPSALTMSGASIPISTSLGLDTLSKLVLDDGKLLSSWLLQHPSNQRRLAGSQEPH